jgi:threonine dehydrogenase-like Zn-dependent dehydrogenase
MGVGIDGAFAKYVKTSEKVCYKISGSVSMDAAVLAEPLACVINGTNKVRARPGETAVIMGGGPVGLLFLGMFKAAGVSKIMMSEVSGYRRGFARDAGVDIVVDPENQDLGDIVLKEIAYGPDIVVDAVGSQMAQGIDIVGKGGRFLIIGGKTDAVASFKQINIITKEISILGTFLANASFESSVKILETGKIDAEKLVTHKMSLDNIYEGIKLLEQGKAIKVVIIP